MSKPTDIEFRITRSDVFTHVKASKHAIEELSDDCELLIEELYRVLDVSKQVSQFDIEDVGETFIQFSNGIILNGENTYIIRKAQKCLVFSISLGNLVDQWLQSIKDDYNKILADQVANTYLHLYTNHWMNDIIQKNNLFHTRKFEFGCELFSLEELKKLIDDITPNIHLTPYLSLSPSKSLVFLVGIGEDSDICEINDSCQFCTQSYCINRIDDRSNVIIHAINSVMHYQVKNKTNLFDLLIQNGYEVAGDCGKNGTCGKCKVHIISKHSDKVEQFLSCQYNITDNIDVFLFSPYSSNRTNSSVISEHTSNHHYGLVIDIGTTTLEVCLVNLESKDIIDQEKQFNPTRQFGSDVISRIQYSMLENDGLSIMNHMLKAQLSQMCDSLIKRNLLVNNQIKSIFVVGNTVMEHIFTNSIISTLGFSPFIPSWYQIEPIQARTIGFDYDGMIDVAPVASGFIGGDVVSGLLTLEEMVEPILYIDLGTNGEIVLIHRGEYVACSTAIGPAFEGGNIECGMLAKDGAITKVHFDHNRIAYHTIKGDAIGICGSGIISLMSALLTQQIVFPTGLFNLIQLAPIDQTNRRFSINEHVYLSQQDIRNIQLAKSAVITGIHLLLQECELKMNDIKTIYLAGALGNAVDIDDCIRIGLFPPIWKHRITVVGNAAIKGAMLAMLDENSRRKRTKLIKQIRVLDFTKNPKFTDIFVNQLSFPK